MAGLMKSGEAAAYLGVDSRTFAKLRKDGLKNRLVNGQKRWLEEDLVAYMLSLPYEVSDS